jgi:GNAT superfamily N-acetyltransferase
MAPKPRLATLDDLPAIRALIPLSVRGLSRIRAFFVHPRAARRGLGRRLLETDRATDAWRPRTANRAHAPGASARRSRKRVKALRRSSDAE